MYSNVVQGILDEVFGGRQAPRSDSRQGLGGSLRDSLWQDALAKASNGILGRKNENLPVLNQGAPVISGQGSSPSSPSSSGSSVSKTPTTSATSPTSSADDELINLISSLLGSAGNGGSSQGAPVASPSRPSGGGIGFGTLSAAGGGGVNRPSSGTAGIGQSGYGSLGYTPAITRDPPGLYAPPASGGTTNVRPGGGFLNNAIRYGTRP